MQKQKEDKKQGFPETGFSGLFDGAGETGVQMGVMGHDTRGKPFSEKGDGLVCIECVGQRDRVSPAFKEGVVGESHSGFEHPFHHKHLSKYPDKKVEYGGNKVSPSEAEKEHLEHVHEKE